MKLRIANDYAAVIEGQRAGNIRFDYHPQLPFEAYLTGVKTEPFVTHPNNHGTIGYYSVILCQGDSPYNDIKDLKGKTIGFVDPNSTSGYNAPRYFPPTKPGSMWTASSRKSIVTGSHEMRIVALDKGTVNCAANWWNADVRFQPYPHGRKRHGKKGGFPDRLQVRPAPRIALCLSRRVAGRPEEKQSSPRSLEAPAKDKAAFDRPV